MISFGLSLLSGFLLSLSFAPTSIWFLAPIALAVLFYSISKTRHPYVSAAAFGFIFNFLTLYWSGRYVGFLPWLLLAILQSLFFLPLGLLSYKRKKNFRLWAFPPLFLALEEARSHIPFGGFGWNRIAYSQVDAPYSVIVRLGGVGALTLLTLYISVLFYQILSRKLTFQILPIIAVVLIASLWPVTSQSKSTISVLAIQGNVPEVGLDFNSRAKEVFYNHARETEEVLRKLERKPDVVVWPENAVDVDPFINSDIADELTRIVDTYKTPLVVGAVLTSRGKLENASILWDRGPVSIYIKRHLTPFGEYIPLRNIAEFISPYAKDVTDFSPGNSLVIHNIEDAKLGPVICYELIDDESVRSMAQNSDLLIVQTNSATFAGTAESRQQLAITRLRAIEFDRSAVSISTTGVSAIIDNSGKVASEVSEGKAGYLFGEVALNRSQTPAGRLGDGLVWANLGVGALLILSTRGWNNADKLHYVK